MDIRSWLRGCATACIAGGAMLAAAHAANAQVFPEKEITLIVNYGAGGTTDTATRILAKKAEEFLGKPIAVINKTGGAGTVGPAALAQSAPDGYTIGVTSLSPLTVTPHTQEVPFKIGDFAFILGYFRYVYGLGVEGTSEIDSVSDLIEKARSGERVTVAVSSTDERILISNLAKIGGIELVQVPYKSSAEKDTAVLGRVVTAAMVGPVSATGHIKSGNMKLIASASPRRWSEFPGVPTIQEQGFDVVAESWAGLAAPVGVPNNVRIKLEEAFVAAASDSDVAQKINGLGLDSAAMNGKEFDGLVHSKFESNRREIEALELLKK